MFLLWHYQIEDYASDVVAFIESHLSAPAAIFGHSLGGMVEISIAANKPDLVRALIVGDSILYKESIAQFQENAASWIPRRQEFLASRPSVKEAFEYRQRVMPSTPG